MRTCRDYVGLLEQTCLKQTKAHFGRYAWSTLRTQGFLSPCHALLVQETTKLHGKRKPLELNIQLKTALIKKKEEWGHYNIADSIFTLINSGKWLASQWVQLLKKKIILSKGESSAETILHFIKPAVNYANCVLQFLRSKVV